MKLNIPERLSLLEILPKEGNFLTMKIVRDLRMSLSFSESELKEYKLKTTPRAGGVTVIWDEDFIDRTKDIQIGARMKTIIAQILLNLDTQQKLRIGMLTLYEKFVDDTGQESKTEKA